jgi:hypothetical protein
MSPTESQTSIDAFKASLRDLFCKADGPVRKCLAVPDTATCTASFDEAWPQCTKGIVLHEGPSEEDREAGRKAGACLKSRLAAKYAPTHADGCSY